VDQDLQRHKDIKKNQAEVRARGAGYTRRDGAQGGARHSGTDGEGDTSGRRTSLRVESTVCSRGEGITLRLYSNIGESFTRCSGPYS
jgi:hypothetical protein